MEGFMLKAGKALKVSIYLSDGSRHHGVATESSILDFLFYRGVCGATVFKGVAGFGADHHLHSASFVELSDRLPVKVEFIETREKVDELLGKLTELAGTGMIEIQETLIAKPASATKVAAESEPVHRKIQGKAKLLRIYVNEADRWNDKPLHEALVEALRANEMAGVTVYRGILGYGVDRELHQQKKLSHDASLMLSVVDCEERIVSFMPMLEKMVKEGMAVLSDVDIITYRYGSMVQVEAAEQEG
jgi:PII-like signaling protein